MASHNELGKQGEELAVAHLQNKGYTILERNYRFQKAEIDILALKDNYLVVVEVKTRTLDMVVLPQESINRKKINLLIKAVNGYVEEFEMEKEVRFDMVIVIKDYSKFSVEHIPNAFYHF